MSNRGFDEHGAYGANNGPLALSMPQREQIAQCVHHLTAGRTEEFLIGAGYPAAAISEAKQITEGKS